ncbi:hypothetical protein ACFFX0_23355 [Citricoccus parietis]|uniref:Uncharacterized protein n=1 Tax=Citricoccus parietis TaxID=592307 RepID=A0ABV5G5T0_9MICC
MVEDRHLQIHRVLPGVASPVQQVLRNLHSDLDVVLRVLHEQHQQLSGVVGRFCDPLCRLLAHLWSSTAVLATDSGALDRIVPARFPIRPARLTPGRSFGLQFHQSFSTSCHVHFSSSSGDPGWVE